MHGVFASGESPTCNKKVTVCFGQTHSHMVRITLRACHKHRIVKSAIGSILIVTTLIISVLTSLRLSTSCIVSISVSPLSRLTPSLIIMILVSKLYRALMIITIASIVEILYALLIDLKSGPKKSFELGCTAMGP